MTTRLVTGVLRLALILLALVLTIRTLRSPSPEAAGSPGSLVFLEGKRSRACS